ncbi:hypothetical protein GCM10027614_75950 [Micromonospora vulcania]
MRTGRIWLRPLFGVAAGLAADELAAVGAVGSTRPAAVFWSSLWWRNQAPSPSAASRTPTTSSASGAGRANQRERVGGDAVLPSPAPAEAGDRGSAEAGTGDKGSAEAGAGDEGSVGAYGPAASRSRARSHTCTSFSAPQARTNAASTSGRGRVDRPSTSAAVLRASTSPAEAARCSNCRKVSRDRFLSRPSMAMNSAGLAASSGRSSPVSIA